ncbi:hypothetical protein D3Z39_08385 [Anaerotruncus colihominis]|uniref:Uncharacterized protein n=1 Tax=Anaerotruncus colihominis TaxID=169435 RepID=A0A845RJ77_9FIRM|nr:hypothetical protein [Anaerotruncus colihominis]
MHKFASFRQLNRRAVRLPASDIALTVYLRGGMPSPCPQSGNGGSLVRRVKNADCVFWGVDYIIARPGGKKNCQQDAYECIFYHFHC